MIRPSSRDGMARTCRDDLPDGESGIFLQRGLDTKFADLPVGQIDPRARRHCCKCSLIRRLNLPFGGFDASLTQITKELRTAFDWLAEQGASHGIEGPVIISGWSAGGYLTAFMLDHPKVAAGLSISGVFELAPLGDSPHVNDKVKLTEVEIETLSPIRLPGVNKPLAIAYGTGELPAMIGSSRDFHAYRSQSHLPGSLIPVVKTNHYTILDELRQPNGALTRAVVQLAEDSAR